MDFKIHRVDVPEWGGEVCLRPLTLKVKDRIEYMHMKNDQRLSISAVAMAGSICDEHGKLLFVDSDIPKLEERDSLACKKVAEKILEINSISNITVDEAEKN